VIAVDVSGYDVEITKHAFVQAMERGIHPDLIEDALRKGKIETYGKHGVKFVCEGKRTIICVGEIVGTRIRIFTVEEGN